MGSNSQLDVADVKILSFTVTDLRFPTSLDGVGSDAMHVGTNGSHPYVRLETNHPGLVGEGIVSLPLPLLSKPYRASQYTSANALPLRHSATAAVAKSSA